MKYSSVRQDYKQELYEELEDTVKNWCARNRVDIDSEEDMLLRNHALNGQREPGVALWETIMNTELETHVITRTTGSLSKLNLRELLRVRRYLESWMDGRDEELRALKAAGKKGPTDYKIQPED